MRKIIIILSLSLGITGCDKWLTVQPDTMITPDELYKSPEGFRDALIGCYQLMNFLYKYDGPMVTGEIEHLAVAWETTKNTFEENLGLHEYSEKYLDSRMGTIFQNFYKVITNLSELIIAIENNNGVLTDNLYSKYLGETLGLRAFLHMELMRMWGPMPSNVRQSKKYLPFVEKIQVNPYEYLDFNSYMEKVKSDLDRSEVLLKKGNISSPKAQYINYYAVLAIQARYHLWMGNNQDVLDYGKRLLAEDTLQYFPLREPTEIIGSQTAFLKESIWKYNFTSNSSTQLTVYNMESYLSNELFYGAGSDARLNQWRTESSGGDEENKVYLNKYDFKMDDEGVEVGGAVPLIRIAEIYLMLMEVETLDNANELYRKFAESRKIQPVAFATRGALLRQLELEYRREFIGEGQLFFAYKRWGTVTMPRAQRSCGESAYVPPIPTKEFELIN